MSVSWFHLVDLAAVSLINLADVILTRSHSGGSGHHDSTLHRFRESISGLRSPCRFNLCWLPEFGCIGSCLVDLVLWIWLPWVSPCGL